MPHKTKKEKIIAEYRRRLKLFQTNQKQDIPSTSSYSEITPRKQIVTDTADSEDNSFIISYFKKDFKKSLFLIAIVITLEISLYYASINNYLRLGK